MEESMDLGLFIKSELELGDENFSHQLGIDLPETKMVIKMETEIEEETDFVKQENKDDDKTVQEVHTSVDHTVGVSDFALNGVDDDDRVIVQAEPEVKEEGRTTVHQENKVDEACTTRQLEASSSKLAKCNHVLLQEYARQIIKQAKQYCSGPGNVVYFPFKCKICGDLFMMKINLQSIRNQKVLLRDLQENQTKKLQDTRKVLCNSSLPVEVPEINKMNLKSQTLTEAETQLKNKLLLASLPRKKVNTKCDQCGATYKRNASLVCHQRSHTGERPYQCNVCLKRFTCTRHLNDHYKIHTGEKPYKCKICDKAFSLKARLRKHCISHTRRGTGEESYYMCKICFKLFTSECSLRNHLGDHADGKPFESKICSYGFGSIRFLGQKRYLNFGSDPM